MPPCSTSCAAPRLLSPPRSPIPAICGSIRRPRHWAFAAPPVLSKCPRAAPPAAKSPSSSIPTPTAGSAASKFSAATAHSSASCRAAPPDSRSGRERAAASPPRRCRFRRWKPSATERSCARRLRRGLWVARSFSSAAPCSNSSVISYGPINPISNAPANCRDANSGPDCSSSGLSCGPCPADSHCRHPVRGRRYSSNPAHRRRSNRNPALGRLCNGNPAQYRLAVDRTRRHCSGSPARRRRQQQQPGAIPPGGRPNAPTLQQPGARPTLQRQPGTLPGLQRAPAGQRKPAKKNEGR